MLKKRKKKEETTGQKYKVRICYACRAAINIINLLVTAKD